MKLISYKFKCASCTHSTVIYFENQFYANEVFIEGNCSACQQYRLLNNGDMGYRSDYPEPMYPPWQLQCVNLKMDRRYCEECSQNLHITAADAEVPCYECMGQMKFVPYRQVPVPNSLLLLIKSLSAQTK